LYEKLLLCLCATVHLPVPRCCWQIVKAVEDGHDVRGITVWTLVDNFEWAYGWGKKFGLYGWQHGDPENMRVLHDTSKVYIGWCAAWRGGHLSWHVMPRNLHRSACSQPMMFSGIMQVVGDMYLELPGRIRDARKLWAARRRKGDTLPRHVPPPEERATEHLKHMKVKSALKTHQVGVL
jgi:hypothetical protein